MNSSKTRTALHITGPGEVSLVWRPYKMTRWQRFWAKLFRRPMGESLLCVGGIWIDFKALPTVHDVISFINCMEGYKASIVQVTLSTASPRPVNKPEVS